jgi:hypothetical protein
MILADVAVTVGLTLRCILQNSGCGNLNGDKAASSAYYEDGAGSCQKESFLLFAASLHWISPGSDSIHNQETVHISGISSNYYNTPACYNALKRLRANLAPGSISGISIRASQ